MIKLILAFFFSTALVQAATIEGASFNKSTQILQLIVTYQGSFKEHEYSLEWDQCQKVGSTQEIAARLIDTGWNDTGRDDFSRVVSFDLSNLVCKPSNLTIFSDLHSRVTLWIE